MWHKWINKLRTTRSVPIGNIFLRSQLLLYSLLCCAMGMGLWSCRPTRQQPTRQLLPHARDYLGWKTLTQRKITNSHKSKNNAYDTAEIYLNRQAYPISNGNESLGQGYPVGSTFVNIHYSESGERQPLVFVMRKMPDGYDPDNNNWRYSVVRISDWTIERDGRLVSCIRCHQKQLARDYVPVMKKDFSTSGE